MKAFIKIGSVLLLSVLFLTTVYAYDGGTAVFCPNNVVEELDTTYEIWLSTQTCDAIHDMISAYGDNDLNYFYLNSTSNLRWGLTINTLKTNTNHATIFSKGHCVPWGDDNIPPYGTGDHFALLDHDGDYAEDNDHIYAYSSGNENYFVFIWHCGTALSYPSAEDDDGYYGMPYAFTRDNDMDWYGSSGDYVVMAWDWQSPQFESQVSWQYPNYNWTYAHYAYLVFDYLCDGYSIGESVNYVSWYLGTCSFYDSGEWGELIGWGNGYLDLPD